MEEKLEVFDLKGKLLGVEEREKFYSKIKEEFRKTKKITRKVKRAVLILMNSEGKLYLQKRSSIKKENPDLFDKTIGGHIPMGLEEDVTIIKECSEELGFPVAVLNYKKFEEASESINLKITGIIKMIDMIEDDKSVRITCDGERFIQPYISYIYIGYYDGPIMFSDGESSGVQVFSLEEVKEKIKMNPKEFTDDIKFMIKKYEKFLKPIKR